ncbi:MAG: tail fiber domain-containing protein [Wenzhouxiangella sp.]|nr:MAG: tail fiber domain-containing protein [Wenzhouxiangella sp.]
MKISFLNRKRYWKIVLPAAAILLASAPLVAQTDEEGGEASAEKHALITVGGQYVDVELTNSFERAILRVSGPEGYALTRVVSAQEGRFITADLLMDAEYARQAQAEEPSPWLTLPDGVYYYEVSFEDSIRASHSQSGSFRVRAGAVEVMNSNSAITHPSFRKIRRLANALFDSLVPTAQADTFDNFVTIANPSGTGLTRLNLTDQAGATITAGSWRVVNNVSDNNRFEIRQGASSNRLVILQGGNVGIGTNAPQSMLHVARTGGFQLRLEGSGNITRMDSFGTGGFRIAQAEPGQSLVDQFTIARDAPANSFGIGADGAVSLGTLAASGGITAGGNVTVNGNLIRLTGTSTFPEIQVQQDGAAAVGIATDSAGRLRFRAPSGSTRMTIEPVEGNVGIGTVAPEAPLHVRRSNGSAQILVEEASNANVDLFTLKSGGATLFRMLPNNGARSWEFRTTAGGTQFAIASPNVPGIEFRLSAGGNAQFQGNVTANGVLLTSSRESKTDFYPLDVSDVLERLSRLEISQWRYKHEPEDVVHIGPIAEEFHEVFGLSNGTHLNLIDTNGITFAAIQALNEQNKRLTEENSSLTARLERLEQALKL